MQRLIGKMARFYPLMIGMGFMIVIIAFLIGYYNAQVAAEYFGNAKAVRETSLLAQRAFIESTGMWLSPFKFLGLGLILGGIVMALRVIIDSLRAAGKEVLSNLPVDRRPELPGPPWYGLLMPVVMMVGEIFFLVALGIGIYAASLANSVFTNPLAQIDAAGSGSVLLSQVQTIHAIEGWLVPLKFLGVSTEFLAIAMGLSTIIYILGSQTNMLDRLLSGRQAAS
jgi:hypothetical protein